MEPVQLFKLADQQAEWLALRQEVIASNIANANTPGYQARQVPDFASVLAHENLSMRVTKAGHISDKGVSVASGSLLGSHAAEITHSGNNVNIEEQLRQGHNVKETMNMNVSVIKAFHRMMLSGLRSGG